MMNREERKKRFFGIGPEIVYRKVNQHIIIGLRLLQNLLTIGNILVQKGKFIVEM